MSFNATLATIYPIGDPRLILNQDTPAGLWHLMAETWTTVGAPRNARAVEEIARCEVVYDKTIEAKGALCQTKFSALAIALVASTARGDEGLS